MTSGYRGPPTSSSPIKPADQQKDIATPMTATTTCTAPLSTHWNPQHNTSPAFFHPQSQFPHDMQQIGAAQYVEPTMTTDGRNAMSSASAYHTPQVQRLSQRMESQTSAPSHPISNTNETPFANPAQAHPRMTTFQVPTISMSSPPVHLDIVNHSPAELVEMLASVLQKIISTNDRMKHSPGTIELPHISIPSPSTLGFQGPRAVEQKIMMGQLLAFHARNIPSITITSYLNRILKYCPTDPEVFISILVYFDRLSKRANLKRLENYLDQTHSRVHAETVYSQYNWPSSPQQIWGQTGNRENFPNSPDPIVGGDDLFAVDSFNAHRLVITSIAVATKFFSDQFYTNSRYARVGGLPLQELNHLELQFLHLNDFKLMITPEELQYYGNELLRYWRDHQAYQQGQTLGNLTTNPSLVSRGQISSTETIPTVVGQSNPVPATRRNIVVPEGSYPGQGQGDHSSDIEMGES